jgi:hypothetical protein
MSARDVLLIRCSVDESTSIHSCAQQTRRTLSGYVLSVMDNALRFEETLAARLPRIRDFNHVTARRAAIRPPGPRTAVLIRCTAGEGRRIRFAATRREVSISAFVLESLRRSWNVRGPVHPPAATPTETPERGSSRRRH